MSPRLPLPDLAQLDATVRAQLERRPPVHLYRLVAHAPTLLEPFMSLGAANFNTLQIAPRIREALILRVAMHHRSAYEIHHHRRIAQTAGLSPEAIEAVLGGATTHPAWDLELADAVALADALVADTELPGALPDPLFARVCALHGPRGYVEMAMVVGFYRMVATFIAATGLLPEDSVDAQHVQR